MSASEKPVAGGPAPSASRDDNPYYAAWIDFTTARRLERELLRKLLHAVRPDLASATILEIPKLATEWRERIRRNEALTRRLRRIAALEKLARDRLEPHALRPDVEVAAEALARIDRDEAKRREREQEAFASARRSPYGPTYFEMVDGFFGRASMRFFERVHRPFSGNPYHKPGQAEAEYGLAMAHFHHGGKDKTVRTMLSSATTRHPVATAQMMVREGDYQRLVGMKSRRGKEIVHARKAMSAYIDGIVEIQTAVAAVEGIEALAREARLPDTRRWIQGEYPPGARLQLIDEAIDTNPCGTALLRLRAAVLKTTGDEAGAAAFRAAAEIADFVGKALERLRSRNA